MTAATHAAALDGVRYEKKKRKGVIWRKKKERKEEEKEKRKRKRIRKRRRGRREVRRPLCCLLFPLLSSPFTSPSSPFPLVLSDNV